MRKRYIRIVSEHMPGIVKTHILILDDEEPLLASMQFLFHRNAYRVSTANTGNETLQITRTCYDDGEPIDVLIVGTRMPDLDRTILIRDVRAFDTLMPILLMTGFGCKELVIGLMELGCNDYIDKPFSLGHLEDRVVGLLAKARLNAAERKQRT